jgi:hypothetical protein
MTCMLEGWEEEAVERLDRYLERGERKFADGV